MRLVVATWNVNSVRLRLPLIERFVALHAPDLLCLQETKCPDDRFPRADFARFGFEHVALHGQKGWHGVAIVSRRPFAEVTREHFCGRDDARHLAVTLAADLGLAKPLTIHNFYIPAGGDAPDPASNDKFAHKLAFLDEIKDSTACREAAAGARSLLVGDLNVAPLEHDVWNHRQLLDVVSHTPVEVDKLGALQRAGGWVDVMRNFVPEPTKLYTWWSYRSPDWAAADKGRRLDHIWASPALERTTREMMVVREARGWQRPSDHVPVVASFDL